MTVDATQMTWLIRFLSTSWRCADASALVMSCCAPFCVGILACACMHRGVSEVQ